MSFPWSIPGLSHVQPLWFSKIQPAIQNAVRISAILPELCASRAKIYCFQVVLLLTTFARGEALGELELPPLLHPRQPLPQPGRVRGSLGTDFTIAFATARCRFRRLDAATKFDLPWRRITVETETPLAQHAVIPSKYRDSRKSRRIDGDNEDVWSRRSYVG